MSDYELFIQDCDFAITVVSLKGKEALSKLYSFDVEIICDGDLSIQPADPAPEDPPRFLRARALLKMPFASSARMVRGIVASITPLGRTVPDKSNTPHQVWRIRIVPIFWLAKHRVNSRIFQNLSTPDIVSEILGSQEYGTLGMRMTRDLTSEHPAREYCMQYQESDYAFIRRILSEEGIFFYFDHGGEEASESQRFVHDGSRSDWHQVSFDPTSNAEVLVLCDEARYPPMLLDPNVTDQGASSLRLNNNAAPVGDVELLASFEVKHTVKPNAVLLRDYDYERPRLNVTAAAPLFDGIERPTGALVPGSDDVEKWHTWVGKSRGELTNEQGKYDAVQAGGQPITSWDPTTADHKVSGATNREEADSGATAQLRVYEHDCAVGTDRVNEGRAQGRLEAHRRNRERASGVSTCPQLMPGYRFHLTSEIAELRGVEGDYAVTQIRHRGEAQGIAIATYENSFECVHANIPYRPRQKPKKRRAIVESATVVGPVGADLHTDKLGRVKVQFHWDLKGSMDEKSCCWVRVAQAWSGAAYGSQFLPRVGTEVLVTFRQGDHDQPVVIGSVYNGVQPFPFLPPTGRTRSGFRTRSMPGGEGYNELSFDDRAGDERVILRAQADLDTYVGRDRMTRVEGSEVKRVEGKRTERIHTDVDRGVGGDERVTIEGARLHRVEGKSDTAIGEDVYTEVGGAQRHVIKRRGSLHAGDDVTTRTDGNHATVVGKHDQQRSFALHVEGTSQLHSSGITEVVSPKGLRLRCGTSVIEIMEDQILVTADKLLFHAPGVQVELHKEGEFWVDADKHAVLKSDTVKLRGSGSMLKLDAKAQLMGPQISLCSPESVEGKDELERELTTIELTDDNQQPCPNQQYVLVYGDGREQTGFLDKDGRAELFMDEGATIRFPGMTDVQQGSAS